VGGFQRFCRILWLNLLLLLALAFVVSPVTITNSLLEITQYLDSEIAAILAEYVPLLVLMLFLWVLVPLLLGVVSQYEGQLLYSDREDSFMKKYFGYLFVAAVLLPMAAMSLGALIEYLTSSYAEFEDYAKRLYADDAGSQFLQYVMTWALLSTPFELYRVPQRLLGCLHRICCCCSMEAPKTKQHKVEAFDFALQYSLLLHVVSIVSFFMAYGPLILLFGTIYLATKHVVDRFLLLCIHPRSERIGVRQATTTMHLYIVCTLLALFGTSALLIARSTNDDANDWPSVLVTALFWLLFVVYCLFLCSQQTIRAANKRNLVPVHLRSMVDWAVLDKTRTARSQAGGKAAAAGGRWKMSEDFTDIQQPGGDSHTKRHDERARPHDRLINNDTAEPPNFDGAYRHPALKVYLDGLSHKELDVDFTVKEEAQVGIHQEGKGQQNGSEESDGQVEEALLRHQSVHALNAQQLEVNLEGKVEIDSST